MIALMAKFYAKPEYTAVVASALKEMAEIAVGDEGCELYVVSQSTETSNLFLLYEHYTDDEALQAHWQTPHYKRLIAETALPALERRERELFHVL